MKSSNEPTPIAKRLFKHSGFRLGLFLIISALVAAQFLGSSLARQDEKGLGNRLPSSLEAAGSSSGYGSRLASGGLLSMVMPQPVPTPGDESIQTFDSNCTTANQDFAVDADTHDVTVCAKVANLPDRPRRIYWVNPNKEVVQIDSTDSEHLTASRVISMLGNWRVYLVDGTDGSARAFFAFTVRDTATPRFDLSVFKANRTEEVAAGGFVTYEIVATNNGPDTASSVVVTDTVPTSTTYWSSSQDSGPSFTRTSETPNTVWTISSLAPGATASFTFTYQVIAGTPAGTVITNTVSINEVTNGTGELHPSDNTWTTNDTVVAGGGGAACSLDCPNSITTTATTHGVGGGAVVDYAAPEASGTCGTVNMSQASHTFFPIGTTTVTAVSDGGGQCSFTVTVIDSPAPTISCPSNLTASTVTGSGASETFVPGPGGPSNPGTPTATGTNVTVTGGRSDGEGLTAAYSIGVTTITWTATECLDSPQCSNGFARSASCTQTVTVTSADVPTITCPSNKTFNSTDCQGKTLTSTEIGTPTTGGLSPTTTSRRGDDLALTDPFPVGQTTITWTATNALGSASCVQVITITATGDTTPPVLTIPADVSVTTATCSALVDDELGVATATDTCSSSVSITRTGVPRVACPIPGDLGRTCESFVFPVGTTDVTYTATDSAGNTSTGVQHVTVHDSTPPTFTFVPGDVGPFNNDSGLCGAYVSDATLGTATVSDNCDTTVIRSGVPAGNIFPVGNTTITYRAKADLSVTATQHVTVVDNTPPVITLTGANPLTVECHTIFTDPGATASDNCAGNLTSSIVVTGTVNPNVVGDYTLTYTVNDGHSNTTSVDRVVYVRDTTAPVITLNGSAPSMWPPNHKYQTFLVTNFVTGVTDSCDTPLNINSVVIEKVTSDETENGNGDGNTNNDIVIASNCKSVQLRSERDGGGNGRIYTITFRVRDASGNTTRVTANVKVAHNPGETVVDSGVHYTVNSICP